MDIVAEIVAPHAAGVLVEAHGPEGDDFGFRVRIELRQRFELRLRDAGKLRDRVDVIIGDEFSKFLEGHFLRAAHIVRVLCFLLKGMFGPQPITDIGIAQPEIDVLGHEVLVQPPSIDDVFGDEVQDCQIGLRLEDDRHVGQIETAMLEDGENRDLHMRRTETPVRHPAPEDRVHLRHIGAPQDECVGLLDIVIAAHRLIDAEGAYEATHGGGHAVAGIGVDIVGTEPGLHQF